MSLKKIGAALIACVTMSLGTFAFVQPAGATNCPAGYTCLWRDLSYATDGSTSKRIQFADQIGNFGNYTYSGTFHNAANSASSVSNEGLSNTVRVYSETQFNGPSFALARNTGDGNLTDGSGHAPSGFNNTLESGRFV